MSGYRDRINDSMSAADEHDRRRAEERAVREREYAEREDAARPEVQRLTDELFAVLAEEGIELRELWRKVQLEDKYVPDSTQHGMYGDRVVPAHYVKQYAYEPCGRGWSYTITGEPIDVGCEVPTMTRGVTTEGISYQATRMEHGVLRVDGEPMTRGMVVTLNPSAQAAVSTLQSQEMVDSVSSAIRYKREYS